VQVIKMAFSSSEWGTKKSRRASFEDESSLFAPFEEKKKNSIRNLFFHGRERAASTLLILIP